MKRFCPFLVWKVIIPLVTLSAVSSQYSGAVYYPCWKKARLLPVFFSLCLSSNSDTTQASKPESCWYSFPWENGRKKEGYLFDFLANNKKMGGMRGKLKLCFGISVRAVVSPPILPYICSPGYRVPVATPYIWKIWNLCFLIEIHESALFPVLSFLYVLPSWSLKLFFNGSLSYKSVDTIFFIHFVLLSRLAYLRLLRIC